MGYEGEKISRICTDRHVMPTIARMVQRGTERLKEVAVINTPIDTGALRRSWRIMPIVIEVERGHLAYSSTVINDEDYAWFVEHGTGLWGPRHAYYEIKPKRPGGFLAFMPRDNIMGARFDLQAGRYRPSEARLDAEGNPVVGERVFVRRVMHPGSPGQHMMATAGAVLEATLGRVLEPELKRWADLTEHG